MGKGLLQKLEKCKHPEGRKTLNLIKKTKKANNRERKKLGNAAKTNIVGRKMFWFFEAVEDKNEVLSPLEYSELIETYLNRFVEELEQITIKQGIGKVRANAHASRESAIKMTLEKEVGDFNGGGLELPDLCDPQEFKKFKEWDGDASKVQHIKVKYISKSSLANQSKMDQ